MNQANLLRIREAVKTDAMGLDWPKMTDDELAASMNAATVSRRRLVPLWEIHKLAIEAGFLLAVEDAAESHAMPAAKAAARIARRYMDNPRFDNLDVTLPATTAMLDALVAGKVLSTEQREAIVALAVESVSFTESLGLGQVLPGHVTKARAL